MRVSFSNVVINRWRVPKPSQGTSQRISSIIWASRYLTYQRQSKKLYRSTNGTDTRYYGRTVLPMENTVCTYSCTLPSSPSSSSQPGLICHHYPHSPWCHSHSFESFPKAEVLAEVLKIVLMSASYTLLYSKIQTTVLGVSQVLLHAHVLSKEHAYRRRVMSPSINCCFFTVQSQAVCKTE